MENCKAIGFLINTGLDPMENHKAIGFLINAHLGPMENNKAIEFLINTGLDPMGNHKATKTTFDVEPPLTPPRNVFKWGFAGGLMMGIF